MILYIHFLCEKFSFIEEFSRVIQWKREEWNYDITNDWLVNNWQYYLFAAFFFQVPNQKTIVSIVSITIRSDRLFASLISLNADPGCIKSATHRRNVRC